jgi:starch-binding outer membrane protein, SusD/RagB family
MNLRTLAPAVAAGFLLLAAACTDPTVQPKSTITSANIFKDPTSYQKFLAKIYAGLSLSGQQGPAGQPDISGIDEGFSQYLRLYWEHEELPTDEAVIAWGDIGLPEMNTQTWNAQSNMVVAMYYRIYFQVVLVNEFLRQTTDDSLTARGVPQALRDQIKNYRAEARFLRALSYWHAIDLFGDVPLVTEANLINGPPPAQSTRAQVYDYIVAELTALKPDLPPKDPANYGRATQPAADFLLAEVYLNAGVYTGTSHYDLALAAASNVIAAGYQIDSSYQRLFSADNSNSPEMVFPIPFDGLKTQTYGGTTFLVHASCGGSMNPNDYGLDGCWYGLRIKPQVDSFYAAGDLRPVFYTAGQSLDVSSISNFNAGYALPKFRNVTSTGQPGSNKTFVDTDFPLFRLGEAYLIYAECQVRGGGGDTTTALAYVNALRARAYGNTSAAIVDSQLTLPFILAERGRELLWEGHRRTDLVRFGQFTGNTYLWAWKGGTAAGTGTDAHYNLYPIPASELVANPNLHQNPGY